VKNPTEFDHSALPNNSFNRIRPKNENTVNPSDIDQRPENLSNYPNSFNKTAGFKQEIAKNPDEIDPKFENTLANIQSLNLIIS
jgi:hypothetical protein